MHNTGFFTDLKTLIRENRMKIRAFLINTIIGTAVLSFVNAQIIFLIWCIIVLNYGSNTLVTALIGTVTTAVIISFICSIVWYKWRAVIYKNEQMESMPKKNR